MVLESLVSSCRFGEVVDCNLVRDRETGKSKGWAFIAYEDTRSCVLAVDNFNGATIMGRTIRCDHVLKYRRPKKEAKKENDEKEKDGIHLPSEDEDYDERRKLIWDYEAYAGLKRRPVEEIRELEANAKPDQETNPMELDVKEANLLSVQDAMQKRIDAVRLKRKNKIQEMVNAEKQEGIFLLFSLLLM